MKPSIVKLFGLKQAVCFSRLIDKRIFAMLNPARRTFATNGDYLYRFNEDGVLDTMEINRRFNFDYVIMDKIDGKTQYFMPYERFRKLELPAYGTEYSFLIWSAAR